MALERSIPQVDLSEESQSERLARKSKEAPYVPIGTLCYNTLENRNTNKTFFNTGLAGCVGAVLYGAYQFRNKGEMSTSVYLMKFRVVAQSMVVVTLGIGVGYSMIDKYLLPKFHSAASKKDQATE